jgi:hypothetical protein
MEKDNVVELKQSLTTIAIKRGTKKLLDDIGEKRDSYDDIITKLIAERNALAHNINTEESINRIQISTIETRTATYYNKEDDEKIVFNYNLPKKPLVTNPSTFRFMITYFEITYKGKSESILQEYQTNRAKKAETYLRIVELVIKQTINPLFKIDKRHILDLDWWERKFKSLGIPESSFEYDIKFELLKLGFVS